MYIRKYPFNLFGFRYPDPVTETPPAGTPPAGTPPAGTPPASWYDGFKDTGVKDWVASYKDAYPDPEAMALKAWNLEKFVGAEKSGKGIIIPDFAKGKPEEVRAFWNRVGAGDKPELYKLPESLVKDPVMVKLQAHAHKVGMPLSHFNETVKFVEGEIAALAAQQTNNFSQTAEREVLEVRTEWGAQYDEKVEAGRRAAAALIPHSNKDELKEVLNKMEGALGAKFTLNFWANVGSRLGEHGYVGGETPHGQMTPEAARLRISELKKDQGFGKKLASGDTDSKAEWTRLHQVGYPEQASVL